MPKTARHMEHLARRGAEVRFRQLVDELKNLTAAFPHLQDTISTDELPIAFVLKKGSQAAGRTRSSRERPAAARRSPASGRLKK